MRRNARAVDTGNFCELMSGGGRAARIADSRESRVEKVNGGAGRRRWQRRASRRCLDRLFFAGFRGNVNSRLRSMMIVGVGGDATRALFGSGGNDDGRRPSGSWRRKWHTHIFFLA